jgi:hypothetical protein
MIEVRYHELRKVVGAKCSESGPLSETQKNRVNQLKKVLLSMRTKQLLPPVTTDVEEDELTKQLLPPLTLKKMN